MKKTTKKSTNVASVSISSKVKSFSSKIKFKKEFAELMFEKFILMMVDIIVVVARSGC